jgi:hypothetical protein
MSRELSFVKGFGKTSGKRRSKVELRHERRFIEFRYFVFNFGMKSSVFCFKLLYFSIKIL